MEFINPSLAPLGVLKYSCHLSRFWEVFKSILGWLLAQQDFKYFEAYPSYPVVADATQRMEHQKYNFRSPGLECHWTCSNLGASAFATSSSACFFLFALKNPKGMLAVVRAVRADNCVPREGVNDLYASAEKDWVKGDVLYKFDTGKHRCSLRSDLFRFRHALTRPAYSTPRERKDRL